MKKKAKSRATRYYEKYSLKELEKIMQEVTDNPANKNPEKNSIYIHSKNARKRMDDISWAITWHLRDLRIVRGEKINEEGYTGKKHK